MRRRVAEAWDSFERVILPLECSDVQRRETRRAFYAGAFVIMDTIADALSPGDDVTGDDEQAMIDLSLEREEYLANLRSGRA